MYEIDPKSSDYGVVQLLAAVLDGRAVVVASARAFSSDIFYTDTSTRTTTTRFEVATIGTLRGYGTPLLVAESFLLSVFERLPEEVKLETAEHLMLKWGEIAQRRERLEKKLTKER